MDVCFRICSRLFYTVDSLGEPYDDIWILWANANTRHVLCSCVFKPNTNTKCSLWMPQCECVNALPLFHRSPRSTDAPNVADVWRNKVWKLNHARRIIPESRRSTVYAYGVRSAGRVYAVVRWRFAEMHGSILNLICAKHINGCNKI